MSSVSVVVPTYNRQDVLGEVLGALDEQTAEVDFEIVVVNDGSSDGTDELLTSWRSRRSFRVLRQENRGPAAARNAGVEVAEGELVAFLGDDTVPTGGWLAAHYRAHQERESRGPMAVVGYTRWHQRMRVTPFLRHINERGLQFGYALIEDPESVPFNFFYTSNLSLPRQALLDEPMNLRFPYPAWEDIELSYRLRSKGMSLVYEPEAVVEHDHPTDYQRFTERQEKAGYSAVVFYRLHPELGPFLGLGPEGPPPLPPQWRQTIREGVVRSLQYVPVTLPRVWDEALRFHYIRGLRRGWQQLPHS